MPNEGHISDDSKSDTTNSDSNDNVVHEVVHGVYPGVETGGPKFKKYPLDFTSAVSSRYVINHAATTKARKDKAKREL